MRRAALVWDSMRLLYGSRFAQTYGHEPNGLWLDAIAELTDEECAAGFTKLRKSGEDWPPSLPKFVAICKPKDAGVRFLGVPVTTAQLEQTLKLEAPRDPELKDRTMTGIRERLGMGPSPHQKTGAQ